MSGDVENTVPVAPPPDFDTQLARLKAGTVEVLLDEWFSEELYEEDGWRDVTEGLEGSYKGQENRYAILKHEASGRLVKITWRTDWQHGPDDLSWEITEVWPVSKTTTEYVTTRPGPR